MDATQSRRRSHRKSRQGCFSCKTRRIKCSESLPVCVSCNVKGLRCVYPFKRKTQTGLNRFFDHSTDGFPPQSLLPASVVKKASEHRYLQHFLTVAHPFLPAGNDEVWTSRVPQLAMQNSHVLSAMLGLSAAHLDCLSTLHEHRIAAVEHRCRALAGLKKLISNTDWTSPEADSTIALAYMLAFQARYMKDGLNDFLTMVRGCTLLSAYVMNQHESISFHLESDNDHDVITAPGIDLLKIDKHRMQKGLTMLRALRPLLRTKLHEQLFSSIHAVFEACMVSPTRGFASFWSTLDELGAYIGSDIVSQLLQTFFIALRLILEPLTQYVYQPLKETCETQRMVRSVTVTWANRILENIPQVMKKKVEWPEAIAEQASRELQKLEYDPIRPEC